MKKEFYFDFSEDNVLSDKYEVIEISNSYADKDICAAMKKTNNKGFMSEDDFNKLPLHVCKPEGKPVLNDRRLYPWAYSK